MLQYPKVYPVLSHKSQAKNLPESAVYMTPPANLEYHDTDHKFKKFKPSLSAELHVLGKTSVQVKGGVPGIPGLDAWRVGKTTNYPSHLDKFHTNLQIPQGQKQTYKREIKEYMIQRYINHATGNHMKSRRSRQANSVNLPHAEQIQVTSGLESETAKLANAVPQTAQSKLAQLQDAVHPQNTGNNVVPPQSAAPQDFQDHPSVYKGPVASIGTADSVAFPMDGKGPALPKVKEDFNIDVHQQGINRITLKDTLPSNFPGPSNPISVMTGAKKQHSGDSAMPGSMEDNTQFSQQGGTSGSSIEPGHFNSITLSENVNLGKYYSGLPAIPSETAMSFPSNLASRNQQQSVGNMLSGPHQNNQPVFTGPNASPENQQRYGDIPAVPGHHPEHISATVNELQNQQNSMNLPRNPAEPKSNGVDNTSAQGSLLVSSGEQSQTSGQQYTGGKPSISSAPELPRSPSGMAPEEKPDRLGAAGPPAGLEYTQGQPDASRDAPAINSAIVSDSTAGQSSASGSDQAPALTNGSPRVTSQTSCAGGYGSSSNGQSETETVFKDQRSRGEQLSVKTNKNNAENLPTPQTHINSMPASHTAFDVSDKFSKRTEKSSKLPVPKKNNTGQQDKAPAPEMSQHDSNATLSIISSDANFEEAIKKPQSRADNIGSVRDGGSNSESSSLTDIKFGSEEVMIQKSKTEVLLPYYGKHVANKTKHNKEMPSILGETMGDDSFNMLPESAMVTKREENDISSQPSLNSVTRNRTLENPKDKLERDEHEQISSFSDVFSRPHSAIVTKELDSTSQLVNVKGKIPSFVSSHTQQQQSQLGDRPSISDIVDDPAALNKEMPSQSLKGVIPQQKRIEEGPVMHGKKNVQIISQSVSRIIKNPARHRSYIKDPAGMYIPELLKRPNFIGGFTAQDDPNTTPSAVSKPIQSELTENVDAKPGYSMNPTNKVLRSTKLAGPNLTNLNIFDKRLRLGDTLGDAFMSSLRGTLDAGFRYKKAGSNPVSDQTLAGSEGYVERDKKNGKEQIDIGVKTENKMKSDNVQKGSIHKLVSEMGKGLNLQGSDINSLDKDLTSTLSHTLQIVDKLLGPPPFQNRRVARSEKQSNRFRKAVRNAHKKRTQNGDERNVKANLLKSSIGMINILLVENNTRPSNHTRSPMGSAAGDIIFDLPRQHKGKHKSKMSKDKKTFKKLGPDMKITETIDVEPTNRTNRSYSDYDYDVKQLPHWMRMAYSGKKGRARVNIGNVNISKAARVVKSVDNIDVAKEPAELASATKTRNSRSGNTVLENSKNKSNGNMQSMLKTCQSRLLQSLGVNDVRSDANLDKISARAISKQNQQQTTLNKRSRFRKMVSNYEQPTII